MPNDPGAVRLKEDSTLTKYATRLAKSALGKMLDIPSDNVGRLFRNIGLRGLVLYAFTPLESRYTLMQRLEYERRARISDLSNIWTDDTNEHVVGQWNRHNASPIYENLFTGLASCFDESTLVLDFGCGPGRNILLYSNRFRRVDGVDISPANIENARRILAERDVESRLFVCNGRDLSGIASDTYQLVISTITMQHIAVHAIRYSYLEEFFRVLKTGGAISIQMRFRIDSRQAVAYFENAYLTPESNGRGDVVVERPEEIEADLSNIGFVDFEHTITPYLENSPGQSIYFKARRPI